MLHVYLGLNSLEFSVTMVKGLLVGFSKTKFTDT